MIQTADSGRPAAIYSAQLSVLRLSIRSRVNHLGLPVRDERRGSIPIRHSQAKAHHGDGKGGPSYDIFLRILLLPAHRTHMALPVMNGFQSRPEASLIAWPPACDRHR